MGFGLHCQVLFQNLKPEVPSSLKKRQLVSKPVGVVVVFIHKTYGTQIDPCLAWKAELIVEDEETFLVFIW